MYPKHSPYCVERLFSRFVDRSNLTDDFLGESCGINTLDPRGSCLCSRGVNFAACRVTSRSPIIGIHFPSSKSEMRRITARRVIAGVQNERCSWVSERDYASHAMGANMRAVHVGFPVSVFVHAHFPRPALIRSSPVNLAPKTVNFSLSQRHKKTARQCKCACGSLESLPNWKVSAVLAQPAGRDDATKNGGIKS